MKLISLELKQWRCFDECPIDFPDGLVGVRGLNGAGKSTLTEAIGWALFGKLRRGAKVGDLPRQGRPPGSRSTVTLEFQLADAVYRVERVVHGSARLWVGSADEPETTQTRATNAFIARELGLTWDVFARTVFAQQKDVAALDPSMTGPARKAHVERLLGLERYRRATDAAKSDAKRVDAELTGLREGAIDIGQVAEELRAAEERASQEDPHVAEAEVARSLAEERLSAADGALEAERERKARFESLTASRAHAAEMLAAVETQVEKLTGRIAERESRSERVEAIAQRAADANAARAQADRWAQLEKVMTELEDAESALRELGYDENAASRVQARLEAARAERSGLVEELEAVNAQLSSATARADALRDQGEAGEASDHKLALKQVGDQTDVLRSERAVLATQLELDRAHIDEVREAGEDTPCPVCHKPYGPEYTQIVAGYEERLTIAETRLPAIDARLESLGTEQRSLEICVSRALRAAEQLASTVGPDKLDDAEAERDRLREREVEIRERIDTLRAEVSTDEAANADLTRRAEAHAGAAAVRAERARIHLATCDALSVDSYDATAHAEAETAAIEPARLRAEHDRLLAEIGSATGLEAEIADLQDSIAGGQARVKECGDELVTLSFDAERTAALITERDVAKQARDEAQERFTQARLQAQATSQEVQTLRARREEAESQRAEIARREALLRQHAIAADILTKYRDHQLQRAWPALETGASELLSATTDGRYADVRLSNDDYKLTIVDRGEAHGLERYSGGEQDLANLCLRLAIASWVAKERGAEVDFVVLDEVFGSQDEDRRRKVITELRALGNRFRQVLVVTHLPDIADFCESQIDVELLEDGLSRAQVVGSGQ